METAFIAELFDFQKLEVYKKAQRFHVNCKALLKDIQAERHVNDQLNRASYSIVLNIAECSGRTSAADRRNFFTISRASVFECVAIIDILFLEKKIDKDTCQCHLQLASEISRMLYVMIRNLKSQ